jgi:hypothetical protein
LSADQLADRSTEWSRLLERILDRQPTAAGMRLRLPDTPDVAAAAADLVVREVQCCAFFTFTLSVDASGVWLEVTTPPDGRKLLDDLLGGSD